MENKIEKENKRNWEEALTEKRDVKKVKLICSKYSIKENAAFNLFKKEENE